MMNPFSNPSYLLPPLLDAFVTILLLVLVWQKGRRDFSSRILCCLLLSVGLWALFVFGMRSSPDTHQAVSWARLIVPTAFAIFVFYYHFSLAYTGTRGQRGILLVSYLFLVITAGLISTRLLVDRMLLEDYGYAPIMGTVGLPLVIGAMLLVGGGTYNLLRRYKVSHSYEERNRLLYLVIASLFPLLGGVLDGLSDLPPAAIWGNLIFCIICSIAILKYHLLDIRVVVRKSLVYLLVSLVIAAPYVSILSLLNHILRARMEPWWVHTIIILLLAILLRPLYSWAQGVVDRLFYRDRYSYLMTLESFSREAHSVTNLKELGSTMVELISGALRVSSISLLLLSEAKHGWVVVRSTGLDSPPSGVVLKTTSLIVKWLRLHGNILHYEQLDIFPQLQSLSVREKKNLEQLRAKLYVPLKTQQGELSGILVLGEKLSQQSYSGEDKQLLAAAANQMAMALENARLYNESQQEVRERKQAEQALRESEEKYRGLVTNVKVGVFRSTPGRTGKLLEINPAMEEITGYSREELLQMNVSDLYVYPEEREAILAEIASATVKTTRELRLRKRDRTEIVVSDAKVAVRDDAGKITYFDGIMEDITERKRAAEEEQRLQQELYLSRRLASIGELAAGVAHEINNPLTGILGFSQRLLRKITNEEVSRDLEIIHSEAQRAARVVQNLLTFARRREPKKEYSNINDILQKALELRAYELKTSNIEVVTDLAPSLTEIMVDFPQIQEVFLNIILNAEQAMNETHGGGKLTIKTWEIKDHIRISFTDDGPGIHPEHLDKVFDPFFTTRAETGGTGLGLSACHGIVTEHGGRIYARSKPGKGATFFVELPLVTEKMDKSKVR